ncbi:MAG: response regulator, partial [Kiritimatiellaeota bacterium]|nr:response regulator [Kiritimatiellota bacterium]
MKTVLIVDDERMTREGLAESLDWRAAGVDRVFCAENGEAGLIMAKRILPDIVLTDIRMPRMDGITMAGRIRDILPECRIIFLSAYSEIDYYKAAIDLKAIRYLDKPIDAARL